jgi:hypothetical protein
MKGTIYRRFDHSDEIKGKYLHLSRNSKIKDIQSRKLRAGRKITQWKKRHRIQIES